MIWLRKFIAWFLAVGSAMCATQAACSHLWGSMVAMILCTAICVGIAVTKPFYQVMAEEAEKRKHNKE